MTVPATHKSDPKSVQVHKSTGAGVDIEWKDGHRSHYEFPYLRNACPCAKCDDEREADSRQPWDMPKPKPGELPMFKPKAAPTEIAPVGKYAISFSWNDNHNAGIYSWDFLRTICPCAECVAARQQA